MTDPVRPHAPAARPPLAELLDLAPHPEGGWFRETWRSDRLVRPDGYSGERASATAIYFALHPGESSAWHTVRSAELWLWHRGGPVRLRLGGDADQPAEGDAVREVVLGPDLERGQQPQVVVAPLEWQAASLAGDEPALVSCVVSPGFDFADFRLA